MSTPDEPLRLRPGVCVAQREPGVLQVGLDPPRRALVADTEPVRRFLDDLRSPRGAVAALTDLEQRVALRVLHAADLIAAPPPGPDGTRARRAATVVDITQVSAEHREELVRSLVRAGFTRPSVPIVEAPDLEVVLSVGEPRRDRFDDAMRAGRPHLAVALFPDVVRVGPFVAPGRSACQRCIDAALAEADPRRALILEQHAAEAERRPLPSPEPTLTAVALAWAVREITAAVDGGQPATWSATLTLGSDGIPQHRPWSRHPHCGCAWDALRLEA